MNIYIYSDESGVFDKYHNEIFVFAGLICLGTKNKEIWSRKYSAAEKAIRNSGNYNVNDELKATFVSNKEKGKLARSLNNCYKFCTIIRQNQVLSRIFNSKKDKQRYLDYAYKMAVKNAFTTMISDGLIDPNSVNHLYFYVDEHTTATNGRYELHEALEQEFKNGTYNYRYDKYFPPIFTELQSVNVTFCNSENKLLVRSADIIANRVYYYATNNEFQKIYDMPNMYVKLLP